MMENDVDLTELDDWLGTLEELQLGLEKSQSSYLSKPPQGSKLSLTSTATTQNSYINRTFLNEPNSPRYLQSSAQSFKGQSRPTREDQKASDGPHSPKTALNQSWSPIRTTNAQSPTEQRFSSPSSNKSNGHVVLPNGAQNPKNLHVENDRKEATAERDLSSLLRDLEVVEERMKELEQGSNAYTRRYSLASSPSTSQPAGSIQSSEAKFKVPAQHNADPLHPRPNTENGFISAQWVTDLNCDRNQTAQNTTDSTTSENAQSNVATPLPPAFLGAGDACVSPPTSPQPTTPSLNLLKQTDAGLWCMNNNSQTERENKSIHQTNNHTENPGNAKVCNKPNPPTREHIQVNNYPRTFEMQENKLHQLKTLSLGTSRPHDCVDFSQPKTDKFIPQLNSPKTSNYLNQSSQWNSTHAPPNETRHCLGMRPVPHSPNLLTTDSQINPGEHVAREVDEQSLISGISNSSPSNRDSVQELRKPNLSLHDSRDQMRLSSSMSPQSSLSDKSLSDRTDAIQPNPYIRNNSVEKSKVKHLIVRIFRPDRTTKAVKIEENMTAGEVASLLTEKNFLRPSTSLVVVEKVPALKVERIFEEHERISDCILSWPTGSQNMLFFEERPDHFGFIESPKLWLGEEFAEVHRYNSSDAVQSMLNNIDQAGFPEWRDYLYIRKPGEKTWSRRLCVLRSSGLYTSKKNKKNLSSTDLIRLLKFDDQFQLYTTTGGWTRLRAPTPHGLAFKPYSAQDPASTHVFCFCAMDENALRNWICRLRIAKYGRKLFTDYQEALVRIQRQVALRHGSIGALHNLNGSMSAYLQRKSSIDILSPTTNDGPLTSAESATSLPISNGSPALHFRKPMAQNYFPDKGLQQMHCMDQRFSINANRFYSEVDRPSSPLLQRARNPQHHHQQQRPQRSPIDTVNPMFQPTLPSSTSDRGLIHLSKSSQPHNMNIQSPRFKSQVVRNEKSVDFV